MLFKHFQTASIWFYGPLSLALSIPIALPLFKRWESVLFYIFGDRMGVTDPFLGKDVAFYLFSFPIYTLIQSRLLLAFAVLAVGLVILYLVKNRLLQQPLLALNRGAKWHLSLLVAALFGLEIWDFMLQRYALVYDTSHQALFHGPGYVQMKVVLPLIWACMVFFGSHSCFPDCRCSTTQGLQDLRRLNRRIFGSAGPALYGRSAPADSILYR